MIASMRSRWVLAACLVPLSFPLSAEESPLKATEVEVCEEIVDRACQGASRSFGPDVELVTFLTRIEGATGEAYVTHVWTFEGREVRRVKLPVKTSTYRTWSSKRVKGAPGKWRVEVLDPLGRSLGLVDFVVEPPREGP
ncbi:DUF2914 domain-containing protein [Acidobacteria bacterium ACD]|nr:MAG: DUF2914 domain-containing protein [Acidobacteriota bacterium]MCE7958946.1 DUF2914 domain-containing protein [Acidobacteria bacterium ACB2]MDL1949438.1 DUF2914 domain-containing protein [Acidobacteria bacterium ACD]